MKITKETISEHKKMLSLIERMEKHMTLIEAEHYQLSCADELMEYMWLKPSITNLNVDIFVDDGGSYERNNHCLLIFIRNGYNKSINEFIPMSVSEHPCVLDDDMDFNITYNEIFAIQDFIQQNLNSLIALSQQKITQEEFISSIENVMHYIAENKNILNEMATLRANESNLPVDIWLDEGATYQGKV